MIQQMLAIWSLVLLPFLNPGWTLGSYQFMYCCLMDFEHHLASLWNECSCAVDWTFFGIALLWDWNENCYHFQSYSHCWVFPIRKHIECSTFMASSFRIRNSSTGIPSPPLPWFLVMLSKAHFTLHSRKSGSRWVITPLWLSGSWRSF